MISLSFALKHLAIIPFVIDIKSGDEMLEATSKKYFTDGFADISKLCPRGTLSLSCLADYLKEFPPATLMCILVWMASLIYLFKIFDKWNSDADRLQ